LIPSDPTSYSSKNFPDDVVHSNYNAFTYCSATDKLYTLFYNTNRIIVSSAEMDLSSTTDVVDDTLRDLLVHTLGCMLMELIFMFATGILGMHILIFIDIMYPQEPMFDTTDLPYVQCYRMCGDATYIYITYVWANMPVSRIAKSDLSIVSDNTGGAQPQSIKQDNTYVWIPGTTYLYRYTKADRTVEVFGVDTPGNIDFVVLNGTQPLWILTDAQLTYKVDYSTEAYTGTFPADTGIAEINYNEGIIIGSTIYLPSDGVAGAAQLDWFNIDSISWGDDDPSEIKDTWTVWEHSDASAVSVQGDADWGGMVVDQDCYGPVVDTGSTKSKILWCRKTNTGLEAEL